VAGCLANVFNQKRVASHLIAEHLSNELQSIRSYLADPGAERLLDANIQVLVEGDLISLKPLKGLTLGFLSLPGIWARSTGIRHISTGYYTDAALATTLRQGAQCRRPSDTDDA
jgi:hypothetical protein